jgi:hypothetical protein
MPGANVRRAALAILVAASAIGCHDHQPRRDLGLTADAWLPAVREVCPRLESEGSVEEIESFRCYLLEELSRSGDTNCGSRSIRAWHGTANLRRVSFVGICDADLVEVGARLFGPLVSGGVDAMRRKLRPLGQWRLDDVARVWGRLWIDGLAINLNIARWMPPDLADVDRELRPYYEQLAASPPPPTVDISVLAHPSRYELLCADPMPGASLPGLPRCTVAEP